jgi:nucleotide-binding universal stress UspA family protein
VSETDGRMIQRIIVGIDGSEPSKAALRWAIRQAELVHGEVEALAAWDAYTGYGRVPYVDADVVEKLAETRLFAAIDEVAGPDAPVPVHGRTVHGDAAQVLVDSSRDADLLVVGNRGHGRFASALLGSVSDRCAHHAKCPVVVIHHAE